MFDSEWIAGISPIIQENMTDINRELHQNVALSISELSSLSDALISTLSDYMSLELSLPDALLATREDIQRSLLSDDLPASDYPAMVKHVADDMHHKEKALLVALLLEKAREKGINIREEDFLTLGDDIPVFAYVKNTLADEAYDVITENIPDARVKYVSSFSEGARMLLGDEVGYCLFPIEEKGGLRLPTVENLLFTQNLKIRRIVPVFGFDGLADLNYALVSKSVYIEPYQREDDRYLEIHIPARDENFSLNAFLFALTLYKMHLYRIQTVSVDRGGEREDYLSLVLKTQGDDFIPILSYLALFCAKYTIVGIYKNLEY